MNKPNRRAILAAMLASPMLAGAALVRNVGTVVCIGNSTTYNGLGFGHDWPTLLAAILGRTVINAGIPSETALDMGERLPDLIDRHQPSHVVICVGSVEIQTSGLYNLGYIVTNIERLANYCLSRGVVPIIASVPPIGVLPSDTRSIHAVGVALYTRQGDLARRRGWTFIDFMRPLADAYGEQYPTYFDMTYNNGKRDQIHPGIKGRHVMAEAAAAVFR